MNNLPDTRTAWLVVVGALGLAACLSVVVDPRLALAGGAAVVAAWIGLRNPHLLVLGIFASILFDRLGVTGAKVAKLPVTASKLAVLGSLGLWVVHVGLTRRPAFRIHPVLGAMVGMTLVTGLSVTFSGDFDTGRFALMGIGMVTILTGLVYVILAEHNLTNIYRTLGVILALSLATSVAGGAANQSGRATGTFGDPNEWATLVLMVSPAVLGGLAADNHPWARLLRISLMGLAPLAVFASGSRAALLVGAAVTVGCLSFLRQRRNELLLCGGAGVVAAPFVVDVDNALERFGRLFGRATGTSTLVNDSSLDERSELLRQGIDLFFDHWLVGAGPGNFARATGFISLDGRMRPAHNTYLEVASEQGLIGLAAGVVFMATVAYTLWRAWQRASTDQHRARVVGMAAGLFAVSVMAATLGLLTFSMAYLMLGIALAVTDQATENLTYAHPSSARDDHGTLSGLGARREQFR